MTETPEELREERKRFLEAHERERAVLFGNEALLIGVIQVVSGGTLIGALSNSDKVRAVLGNKSYLVLLTLMGFALILSVLAAYWKHQYKMWHVKGNVSTIQEEQDRRQRLAIAYLTLMRSAMFMAVVLIVLSLLGIVVSAWLGDRIVLPEKVISTIGQALVLLGSLGMLAFAMRFPLATGGLWEMEYASTRWLSLKGQDVWRYSWTAILLGTVLQIAATWW
ncbi:MAG: hypothetical protein A2W18_13330 [Candidatus Muproteobacteria bacterium RBG_16_60_9]|uniref:Uncharacterized protein n=1 Tax=Candidatus Muproteobacteria bacterium RBG_16_60_9 TaxID=1817755 RepID=A0A1F6UYI8_9PROT|nr:MAG: hypothetical protein A2W18_13330 [Candidatus Muproteobacteria bacterium RBG_16_60_9]